MSIKIVFYGDLKPKDQQELLSLSIKNDEINTIYDILDKFNIKEDEVGHIFVNHQYCGPGIEVKDGDRVALFPRRMAIMFEEIPHSNSIEIIVKFSDELRKTEPKSYLVDIPRGSVISNVLKKFNLNKDKLKVMVNDVPSDDRYILKENDIITIFSSSTFA